MFSARKKKIKRKKERKKERKKTRNRSGVGFVLYVRIYEMFEEVYVCKVK